jgi:hypothetical protein
VRVACVYLQTKQQVTRCTCGDDDSYDDNSDDDNYNNKKSEVFLLLDI